MVIALPGLTAHDKGGMLAIARNQNMRNCRNLSTILVFCVCAGCSSEAKKAPQAQTKTANGKHVLPRLAIDKVGSDRSATVAALRSSQAALASALGAYAVESKSKLTASVPSVVKKQSNVVLSFRRDKAGQYHGVKNTSKHYGLEVIWRDGWLYRRLRHSRFTRRRLGNKASAVYADRIYGSLPAYVALLGPFLSTSAGAPAKHLGRDAIKVSLSKAKTPRPPTRVADHVARKWRRKIDVRTLVGHALFDKKTGVPLVVKLDATWTFVPPKGMPASGIPTEFSAAGVGKMTLSFQQRVTTIGAIAAIVRPKKGDLVLDARRLRLEIERQIVVGERVMPSHWPKVSPEVAPPPHKSWRP